MTTLRKYYKISNLQKDNSSWSWTISHDDLEKENYFTNRIGEGIFLDDGTFYGKQVAGTCQFSLSGMSVSGARKKLNRYHNRD